MKRMEKSKEGTSLPCMACRLKAACLRDEVIRVFIRKSIWHIVFPYAPLISCYAYHEARNMLRNFGILVLYL